MSYQSMMKQEFGITHKKNLKKQRDRQKREWKQATKNKKESSSHFGRERMSILNHNMSEGE